MNPILRTITLLLISVPLFAGCPGEGGDDDDSVADCADGDADADGVCDADDVCTGDDATGDTDADGVCDDTDLCNGDDSTGDTDSDGVCDDTDVCDGDDATGDTDTDGICDDTDLCNGDNSTGDTDSDGVCDDIDVCDGDDATGDTDTDGVCDDNDVCTGDDYAGDTDGDGLCDDTDPCPESTDNGDDDADGVCNADDTCPGYVDSTCTTLPLQGGSGGTPVGAIVCPPGKVATGMALQFGWFLENMSMTCEDYSIDSNGDLDVGGGIMMTMDAPGGPGGDQWVHNCDPGSWMVGQRVLVDTTDLLVHTVVALCTDNAGPAVEVGQAQSGRPTAGGIDMCPDDNHVIGFSMNAGSVVDAIGLICAPD